MEFDLNLLSTLGLLLASSLVAGLIAELIHLPKVTAYLLVGLALGPSLFDVIPKENTHSYEPLLNLAMALVLFNLGSDFDFKKVRKIARRGLILAAGELIATFAFVFIGMMIFRTSFEMSVLLAALALATAPATTVLVLKEFRSEGPITETTGFLVAINNLVSIVMFEVAFLCIRVAQGEHNVPVDVEMMAVVREIFGSMVLGLISGLVLSFACGFVPSGRWIVLLVATITFSLGLCSTFGLHYLLTFLIMGVTVANTSDVSDKIVEELNHMTGLLCVLFFAVHGVELNLHAFLSVGILGAVYVVCRTAGKWLGIYSAARIIRQPPEVRTWLGTCLLAQAGVAIALSSVAVSRDSELGRPIQTIILGTVVFFEIIGPLMIRQSLINSGEVPIAEAIHHSDKTVWEQIRDLIDRVRMGFGQAPISQATGELTIERLVKSDSGIHQTANMDQVIAHIEHSHDNTYAVVDDENTLVGMISYSQLSNAMFDTTVSQLVCAADLAMPVNQILHPEDSVSRALTVFNQSDDDCIPVVTTDAPHSLIGVVRRSDLMHLLIKKHQAG